MRINMRHGLSQKTWYLIIWNVISKAKQLRARYKIRLKSCYWGVHRLACLKFRLIFSIKIYVHDKFHKIWQFYGELFLKMFEWEWVVKLIEYQIRNDPKSDPCVSMNFEHLDFRFNFFVTEKLRRNRHNMNVQRWAKLPLSAAKMSSHVFFWNAFFFAALCWVCFIFPYNSLAKLFMWIKSLSHTGYNR